MSEFVRSSKPQQSVAGNRPISPYNIPPEEKQPEKTKRRKLKTKSLSDLMEEQQTFKTDIEYTPELYNKILRKWKESERFEIQEGIMCTGNTNIKNMHEFSNTGLRSNVYVITIMTIDNLLLNKICQEIVFGPKQNYKDTPLQCMVLRLMFLLITTQRF